VTGDPLNGTVQAASGRTGMSSAAATVTAMGLAIARPSAEEVSRNVVVR
jgi:hypothetical protein